MRRANDNRGSRDAGPAANFWMFTLFVAAGLLIVLFIAAFAGGYLP